MPFSGQTNLALVRIAIRSVGMKRLLKDWTPNAELPGAILLLRLARAAPSIGVKEILKKSVFRKFVDNALQKGDVAFLKAIGRELERAEMAETASKLEWFLIRNWDNSFARLNPKTPSLDKLNRESLAVVCRHYLNDKLSADAVEKTRARLGLKPAKGKKMNVIKINGRLKSI